MSAFSSKLAVVWNMPDPAHLIALAQRYRLDGVDVKIGDGNARWGATRGITRDNVARMQDAGLVVTGWHYTYCDGERNAGDRGDGIPAEEADVMVRQAADLLLDGISLDLEVESYGRHAGVAECLDRVIQAVDVPIGVFCWADRSIGPDYVWPELAAVGNAIVWRPMCYRPVWTAERMYAQIGDLLSGRTVAPAWGVTEGRLPDVVADMALADGQGIVGESYWEQAAMTHRHDLDDLIRNRAFSRPAPPALTNADYEERFWRPIAELADRAVREGNLPHSDQIMAITVKHAVYANKVAHGADPA